MADGWEIKGKFRSRVYPSYEAYIEMQGTKLGDAYGEKAINRNKGRRGAIAKHIPELGIIQHGMKVLCLGARLGGEVAGFIDLGCFAVGIDVNPGKDSLYVIYGDFHHLQFADNTVDVVYTNSLDHALDLNQVMAECHRVLVTDGYLITENKGGTREPNRRPARSDKWDCMEWECLAVLKGLISSNQFDVVKEYKTKGFTPWGMVFRKLTKQLEYDKITKGE